jgi:hypothetical protein
MVAENNKATKNIENGKGTEHWDDGDCENEVCDGDKNTDSNCNSPKVRSQDFPESALAVSRDPAQLP